jgi:antitoxin HicB
MRFPITMTPNGDGSLSVTCQSLPEIEVSGASKDEALARSRDALREAIGLRMRSRQPVPDPIGGRGGPTVDLSASVAAKVALHNAMLRAGISRAELGRRLGVGTPHVSRLLKLEHGSRLDHLEAALAAVGQVLEISARAA